MEADDLLAMIKKPSVKDEQVEVIEGRVWNSDIPTDFGKNTSNACQGCWENCLYPMLARNV